MVRSSDSSQAGLHETLQRFDGALVSFVKRPLLDSPRAQESRIYQNVEVLTRRRLAHLQLAGNEEPADSILDEISIHLRGEVFPRRLQPLQNPASGIAGDGAKGKIDIHIAIRQLPNYNCFSWQSVMKK